MLFLLSGLMYFFFDKIKKIYQQVSIPTPQVPITGNVNVASKTEILDSISQEIAKHSTSINHDDILDTIRIGLLSHSEINSFEMEFTNTHYVEVPKSVHNKQKILGIQIIDDKNEIVYPPVRITNDLTVIVDMASDYSGVIKIF